MGRPWEINSIGEFSAPPGLHTSAIPWLPSGYVNDALFQEIVCSSEARGTQLHQKVHPKNILSLMDTGFQNSEVESVCHSLMDFFTSKWGFCQFTRDDISTYVSTQGGTKKRQEFVLMVLEDLITWKEEERFPLYWCEFAILPCFEEDNGTLTPNNTFIRMFAGNMSSPKKAIFEAEAKSRWEQVNRSNENKERALQDAIRILQIKLREELMTEQEDLEKIKEDIEIASEGKLTLKVEYTKEWERTPIDREEYIRITTECEKLWRKNDGYRHKIILSVVPTLEWGTVNIPYFTYEQFLSGKPKPDEKQNFFALVYVSSIIWEGNAKEKLYSWIKSFTK